VQRQNTRSLVDKTYHLLVFRLRETVSQEIVESALTMAVQRFGRTLAITGTEAFRQQAVTAGAKLNVVFADPAMEQQRLALVVNNSGISAEDSAARYIAERQEKRDKGINILPHRRYTESDAGKLPFAGLREINGKSLMLLQTQTEMLVLPIDADMAHRCQHLSIGSIVDVTAHGLMRSRGRRM
jgi:hypothetical protein